MLFLGRRVWGEQSPQKAPFFKKTWTLPLPFNQGQTHPPCKGPPPFPWPLAPKAAFLAPVSLAAGPVEGGGLKGPPIPLSCSGRRLPRLSHRDVCLKEGACQLLPLRPSHCPAIPDPESAGHWPNPNPPPENSRPSVSSPTEDLVISSREPALSSLPALVKFPHPHPKYGS